MKHLSLALALAALSVGRLVSQQSSVVVGVVTDEITGFPIGQAELRLERNGLGWNSRNDGGFRILVASFPDTLLVRKIGYRPMRIILIDPQSSKISIPLTPAPTQLTDLVAIAGPIERTAAELTLPVTRIDREELQVVAPTSVDQLLAQLPGLQQLTAPPASSGIMIRGITDSRVLVLVDGEPTPGGALENRDLSRVSTQATERVEVVKGPLSVRYGSQAIGGTINLVSRAPEGAPGLQLNSRIGSFGRKEVDLTAESGGSLAWRVTGGWRGQDRLPGQVQATGTQHRVWDGQGTLRTQAGNVALRFDAQATRERQRWPLGGGFFAFSDSRSIHGWGEVGLLTGEGTLKVRLAAENFTNHYREALNLTPYAGSGAPEQSEVSAKLRAVETIPVGAHLLDLGVEGSISRATSPGKLLDGLASDRMLEVWAQDGVGWRSLFFNTAGRITWNSRWGSAITPSLGVAIEPLPSLRFRTGVARGFRGPSFKELGWRFHNVTAGYAIEGNPDLVPESSWQLYSGGSWAPSLHFSIDLDLYRNTLHDMIELIESGTNSAGLIVYATSNIDRARTQGMELSLDWSDARHAIRLGYDRMDARDLGSGRLLSRRAPHTARLRATRFLGQSKGVRLDLTGVMISDAPVLDGSGQRLQDQQGWVGWNLAAQARVNSRILIDAGVDNLLDSQPQGWTVSMRRAFRVGITAGTRGNER